MPGGYKRKKYHFGDTHLKKGWKLKRRTKVRRVNDLNV